MEKILSTLLYRSNCNLVNTQDLHLQLLSHNEYPSIKAVTDTLDYFGIDNVAANVPVDALSQLPEHFLALIGENQVTELVLVRKKQNKILYIDQTSNKHTVSWDDFSQNWTGTIIAIEQEEKKSVNQIKSIPTTYVLLGLVLIFAIGVWMLSNTSVISAIYLSLSAIGLIISYLTTREELGIKDKVTTKVCGAISGDTHGCSNVINSREGKIFGVISLADASLLFFASTMLFGLLNGTDNSIIYCLAILSLPVVLLSIYLQSFRLKQFCLLCLLISTVLISQFVLLQTKFTNWDFSLTELVRYLFIVTVATFLWLVIKKFWKDSNLLVKTLKEYLMFKRNENFFRWALESKKQYNVNSISLEHSISFGPNDAALKIHAVTNPYCGYCKEPFEAYMTLIEQFPHDFQLNVVFSVPIDFQNDSTRIAQRIAELYQESPSLALDSLRVWYNDRDPEAWFGKFKEPVAMLLYSQELIQSHKEWCESNNLKHTPETILNGYEFPKREYELMDLRYMIEEFHSQGLDQNRTSQKNHVMKLTGVK